LPEMDGIEILKNIRENKLAESIPVIMLTNQNDEKNISEAKKLGIAGYIVKASATPSEVVAEVMRVIKKS
jgi:PleD family two-component response regulator